MSITIYIEGRKLKVPHGAFYQFDADKDSTVTMVLGD